MPRQPTDEEKMDATAGALCDLTAALALQCDAATLIADIEAAARVARKRGDEYRAGLLFHMANRARSLHPGGTSSH